MTLADANGDVSVRELPACLKRSHLCVVSLKAGSVAAVGPAVMKKLVM